MPWPNLLVILHVGSNREVYANGAARTRCGRLSEKIPRRRYARI